MSQHFFLYLINQSKITFLIIKDNTLGNVFRLIILFIMNNNTVWSALELVLIEFLDLILLFL